MDQGVPLHSVRRRAIVLDSMIALLAEALQLHTLLLILFGPLLILCLGYIPWHSGR